jgi:hypothetical protein
MFIFPTFYLGFLTGLLGYSKLADGETLYTAGGWYTKAKYKLKRT